MEAIENIRTIQALTLEEKFHKTFSQYLEFPHQSSHKKAFMQVKFLLTVETERSLRRM
jgi:hypothetical protein